jgi:ribose-phosphate pyrophosphokinase
MVSERAAPAEFVTPEQVTGQAGWPSGSPRGRLLFVSCRSGAALAHAVTQRYDQLLKQSLSDRRVTHLPDVDFQFSDGETCVRLPQDVNGCDVYLFQSLYDPTTARSVDENYMALLAAARTLREWGANHVTAVVPYLAYARQDKPTRSQREPTTARLLADLSAAAGIDRVVTWHVHTSQLHGFYGDMTTDMLDPVPFFVEEYRRFEKRDDTILVAPDAGAAKLVTTIGRALCLDCAIASKYRPHAEEARVADVIGDFASKRIAIVIDDMISSGGTVHTLIQNLVETRNLKEVYLGVSHNLCLEQAQGRLIDLHHNHHLQEMVVTNSIPQAFRLPFVVVRDLDETLAYAINRIHYNRSLDASVLSFA